MQAIYNGQVIAEASQDEIIFIEGNWYFPPESTKQEFFRKSDTPYTCPWKGKCQYFDVSNGTEWVKDGAWSYPEPYPDAIKIVGKDFSNYVAFTPNVVEVKK